MSKQSKKTTATELVAKLNAQYQEIERNLRDIKTAADAEIGYEFFKFTKEGERLDAEFEQTLNQLKEIGETVKFDDARGEYFLGDKVFRMKLTVVSEGFVEVKAPNEQIARLKAEKLADYDEIDLVEVSGKLESVTEAV